MRIFLLLLLCGISLLLTGCGDSAPDTIHFSQFAFPSQTPLAVQHLGLTSKYTMPSQTETGDSLIIMQEKIDPNASYTGWLENNIQTLREQYPRLTLDSQEETSFDCKGEDVTGSLVQRTLAGAKEDEDPLYLVQHFFIYKADAFVLSFASPRSSARSTTIKHWNDTYCP